MICQQTFYLVWNESRGKPTFKHENSVSTENEARRLAKLNPGEEFHVLASICTFHVQDPVIKTMHVVEPEDMPF